MRGGGGGGEECVNVCVCVTVTGESLDEMRLLEEQARRIAEESKKDGKPKTMMFVK